MLLDFLNGYDIGLKLLDLVGDLGDIGTLLTLQVPGHHRQS